MSWHRALLVCWVLLLAVGLYAPWIDVADRWLPLIQATYVVWLGVAAITAVILLLTRRWLPFSVLALLAVVSVVPLISAGADLDAPADAPTLTVLSINLQYGSGDRTDVVRAVHDTDADVLVLLEVDAGYLAELRPLLQDVLRYGWAATVLGGAAGTVILARTPLPESDAADTAGYAFQNPTAGVDLAGTRILLRGVHLQAPVAPPAGRWREELSSLAAWVRARPPGEPVVLLGDFNAGVTHPGFRSLASEFAIAPSRWSRTWPVGTVVPRFVGIDHVLARGLAPLDSGTIGIRGTDHRGVWARLALTG